VVDWRTLPPWPPQRITPPKPPFGEREKRGGGSIKKKGPKLFSPLPGGSLDWWVPSGWWSRGCPFSRRGEKKRV